MTFTPELTHEGWRAQKTALLQRPYLDCGCRTASSDPYLHVGCSRLVCGVHATAPHECPGAEKTGPPKPSPVPASLATDGVLTEEQFMGAIDDSGCTIPGRATGEAGIVHLAAAQPAEPRSSLLADLQAAITRLGQTWGRR